MKNHDFAKQVSQHILKNITLFYTGCFRFYV